MTKTDATLLWTPRIAGIGVALFLALFALDAFSGKTWLEAVPEFAIHLAPSLLVLAIVAIAWRHPQFGAGAFLLLAAAYAVMVGMRLDWVAVIGGPLLMLSVLFAASARVADRT